MRQAEPPQAIVLDASVAVRWIVTETGSEDAATLLEGNFSWVAPRLLLTEVASALRRKATDGGLNPTVAGEALDALLQAVTDGVVRLTDDERVVAHALSLALSLGHKLPDCLYLAIAEREGAALATADGKLARLARSRGVTVFQVPHA